MTFRFLCQIMTSFGAIIVTYGSIFPWMKFKEVLLIDDMMFCCYVVIFLVQRDWVTRKQARK